MEDKIYQITDNKRPYRYQSAEQLKDTYKSKLLKQTGTTLFNKDDVDLYLKELNNCNTWEEIEEIYNQRPLNREIR